MGSKPREDVDVPFRPQSSSSFCLHGQKTTTEDTRVKNDGGQLLGAN